MHSPSVQQQTIWYMSEKGAPVMDDRIGVESAIKVVHAVYDASVRLFNTL